MLRKLSFCFAILEMGRSDGPLDRCRLGGQHTRVLVALCRQISFFDNGELMAPPSFLIVHGGGQKGARRAGGEEQQSSHSPVIWRIKGDLRVLKTRSANLNLLWKGYLNDEKTNWQSQL